MRLSLNTKPSQININTHDKIADKNNGQNRELKRLSPGMYLHCWNSSKIEVHACLI